MNEPDVKLLHILTIVLSVWDSQIIDYKQLAVNIVLPRFLAVFFIAWEVK